MVRLFNYLTRKKETFRPFKKGRAGLYTCGPTVYDFAHIGNLRTYIFEDVLRRTLEFAGYRVRHVMNVTDVGHLTSDADTGEDKVELEARKEKKSVWDIASFYTKTFLRDIKKLTIQRAHVLTPATKHVQQQIRIITQLFKNGFAYETSKAIYFHVPKFKGYETLSRQPIAKRIVGAREEVVVDKEKKHPADFVLWFKLVGRFKNHTMRWSSPWGLGFPGWHIECSTISSHYLGQPFDIHTGGIDHLFPHHTNEIAQSEGAYGKPLARFWIEGEHLLVDGRKMSKSLGNIYTLADLGKRGFNPLAFRYLVLTAHYRSKLNFTWESLRAAEHSLDRLHDFVRMLLSERRRMSAKGAASLHRSRARFQHAIFNDLDTPKALALIWELVRRYHARPERFNAKAVFALLHEFDAVFGLGLKGLKPELIPKRILALAEKREELRKTGRWKEADRIRETLRTRGFIIEDTPRGARIKPA